MSEEGRKRISGYRHKGVIFRKIQRQVVQISPGGCLRLRALVTRLGIIESLQVESFANCGSCLLA
jgi:hypothetical protein